MPLATKAIAREAHRCSAEEVREEVLVVGFGDAPLDGNFADHLFDACYGVLDIGVARSKETGQCHERDPGRSERIPFSNRAYCSILQGL